MKTINNIRLISAIAVLALSTFLLNSCNRTAKNETAQTEVIKAEIGNHVKQFIKGAEAANYDFASDIWLNSADFSYRNNNKSYNYSEFSDMLKTSYQLIYNQLLAEHKENFRIIDNSAAIYTMDGKWISNMNDGSVVLTDPWFIQFVFIKRSGTWKVINCIEISNERKLKKDSDTKSNREGGSGL